MIHIFNNIDNAKSKLYEMVNIEVERCRPFFVDNDFFDNQYPLSLNLRYFCIKEREVTDWSNYTEKNINKKNSSNVIYFNNFTKKC